MSGTTSLLRISGRSVPVSNLDKIFYPTGYTKGDVINYYIRVAPHLLPHLKRYPNGVNGEFFYEKKCPPYRPSWMKTAPMFSKGRNADIHYCLIDNLASLVWAANLADLERTCRSILPRPSRRPAPSPKPWRKGWNASARRKSSPK